LVEGGEASQGEKKLPSQKVSITTTLEKWYPGNMGRLGPKTFWPSSDTWGLEGGSGQVLMGGTNETLLTDLPVRKTRRKRKGEIGGNTIQLTFCEQEHGAKCTPGLARRSKGEGAKTLTPSSPVKNKKKLSIFFWDG